MALMTPAVFTVYGIDETSHGYIGFSAHMKAALMKKNMAMKTLGSHFSVTQHVIEQISYECEKSRHTARSRHRIEEIFSTNHIARKHFSSNQNAKTWHHHGQGMARPYRNFFTVI
jgi:hypothetical protein